MINTIFLDKYFFLSENAALVSGAMHSIIIDFKNKCVYRPNVSSKQILELGENGYTVSEAVDKLKSEIEASDTISFIEEFTSKGLIQLSASPKLLQNEEAYLPKLDFISIEVVSKCNLKCIHCYAESEPVGDMGLPTDALIKIIAEASELGCKNLQLTGGECTLRDDLVDLIKHAKDVGFKSIEVFTNGTLLTEDLIKFFAREGILAATSLHSFRAKTHDAITGVPGSFASTLRNLKLLLSYGISTRCATVAMKLNEEELDGTISFLSKLGVLRKLPDPIRPRGRGMLSENWPNSYGLSSLLMQPSFCVSRNDYEKNMRGNSCWCGKVAITSSGNVLPCVFARDNIAGNITENSLAKIIGSELMQSFWSLTKDKIDVCKDCEYRYLCRDCRPWSYGLTGNIFAKYPRCTYDPYTGEWGTAESALIYSYNCKNNYA